MTAPPDLNLFSAWQMWGSGSALGDAAIYGIRAIWWGRIGKALEFLGGAMIIVDIIGPERLRRWAEDLKHLRDLRLRLANLAAWVNTPGAATVFIGSFVLLTIVGYQLEHFPDFPFRTVIIVLCAAPYILFFVYIIVILAVLVLERFIVLPIADFLSSGAPAVVARIVSFLLLIVGTHFDMLTS